MTYPSYNTKESENIVCWTCQHFQRRENGPSIANCQGECRINPPIRGADAYNETNDIFGVVKAAFAFVPFGNTTWCSQYSRSLEENIPGIIEGKGNCLDQNWSTFVSPWDNMSLAAPRLNKKPTEETCWYCDHFQRSEEVPSSGNQCTGYCFLNPPQPYLEEALDWEGAGATVMKKGILQPEIINGAYMWCSQWKRARQTVPDPPSQSGQNCAPGS